MGFWEVLRSTAATWTESVPGGVLLAVLIVLGLASLSSSGVVFAAAGRVYRSGSSWTLLALLPAFLVAALGLFAPSSFHWFLIGGLLMTCILAVVLRSVLARGGASCSAGHPLAGSWNHCPLCPAPPPPRAAAVPAAAGVRSGAYGGVGGPTPGVAGVAGAAGGGLATRLPGAAPAAVPAKPKPSGPAVAWLVPEGSRTNTDGHAVTAQGATIGKNTASDIVISDSTASWDHAKIIVRDGTPTILDQGSTNGTWVNGEKVESSMLINDDRLQIGDTTFKVVRA